MLQKILNLIFPIRCLACRSLAHAVLCETCASLIRTHGTLFCGRCRARLPLGKRICHRDFPYLLGAAVDYSEERVRALIHGLKFRYIESAGPILGNILAAYLRTTGAPLHSFAAVPIPLSIKRERIRGFNQSLLIAEAAAKSLQIPFFPAMLTRIGHAEPQSETRSREERLRNVRGVFRARRPLPAANILLIDDVTTSGATFFEAARALREAGARRVIAAAVAQA